MKKSEKISAGLVGSMSNIVSSFSSVKIIAIVSVLGALVFCIGCFAYSVYVIQTSSDRVYILDEGSVMSASSENSSLSREDELRDQLLRFHELFFNIPPDMSMIQRNVERALALSDRSVYQYWQDLSESGFYKKLVSNDAYQQVSVKDIELDMSSYPYKAKVVCDQWITRTSNMSLYTLVTTCVLERVPRSPKNLHGVVVRSFEVVDNRLIETRNR